MEWYRYREIVFVLSRRRELPDIIVLLVEDERLLDRVVTDALRTIGLACQTVQSAEDALQQLEAQRYDLMILDLRLQHGSGVTVLEQARRRFPDLPVLLVTAYTMTDDLRRALALGIDALLYKPFDIDTLLATTRALLQRRRPLTPTHAVVQMASSPSSSVPKRVSGLEQGVLASLKQNAFALACRVRGMDEQWLSVESERIVPPENTRWLLEWTGSDALYQFNTRVVEYLPRESSALWLLRQPTLIRRLQRRRHPRVPLQGRAFISLAGRLQRATEATLVNLSETGACVILAEPPHRGAQLHLEVQAETESGILGFQREGVVRSVVAFVEHGQPRYRVGLQLERLPNDAVKLLRQIRMTQLTGIAEKTPEVTLLRSE